MAGKMFPSYVAFTADGQLLVGEPARRQAVTNPEGTVTAAKRKMGTSHVYKIHNKEYTPQQISAFILQKIKRDAEAFLLIEVDGMPAAVEAEAGVMARTDADLGILGSTSRWRKPPASSHPGAEERGANSPGSAYVFRAPTKGRNDG